MKTRKSLIYNDAQGGNRTRMPLPARDFKSLVSTNSTTRASVENLAVAVTAVRSQKGSATCDGQNFPNWEICVRSCEA